MLNSATTWKTADGRVIPLTELGDQHLVNILHMIETNRKGVATPSGMLDRQRMLQYGDLVIEAVRRGLFAWNTDRKYLSAVMSDIEMSYRTGYTVSIGDML